MNYKVGDNVKFVLFEEHKYPIYEGLPFNYGGDPGDLTVINTKYKDTNLVVVYSSTWFKNRKGHGGGQGGLYGHRFLNSHELELAILPTLKPIEDMENYKELFV